MPRTRCPNGTRKNKKTGECEKKSPKNKTNKTNKQVNALIKKKKDIVKRIEKMGINFDFSDLEHINIKKQEKQFKLIKQIQQINNEIEILNDYRLTENEVVSLLANHRIDNYDNDYMEIKRKLMNLKYNENYKSCFTGEKLDNLMQMADDIISCSHKYGDNLLRELEKHD